jgi:hypothetical protein
MNRCVFLVMLSLSCLGDVEVPPEPPTVAPVSSPTTLPTQRLSGSKTAGTAVLVGGVIVVPHDDETSWSYDVSLSPGENRIVVESERRSGLRSRRATEVVIVFEPPCPSSPMLGSVPKRTRDRAVMLQGSKPRGASLRLNGMEVVPPDDAEPWAYTLALPDLDGPHDYELVARDAKDRDSDPVRFTIVLDRTPPAIAVRYPSPEEIGVPANAMVSVTFDDAIEIDGLEPVMGTVVVRAGGQEVPGLLVYHVLSRTIAWTSMTGALAPNVEHEVTVDPMFVRDEAGNLAPPAPPGWVFTFTTGSGPDLDPPPAPTVMMPPAEIMTPSLRLDGTKDAESSIHLNGDQIVPVDGRSVWSYELSLPVGTSSVALSARSVAGVEVVLPAISIVRVIQKPAPPTIDPSVPAEVATPKVALLGGRPADTSVLLDGNVIACRSPDVTWSHEAPLSPGVNDLTLSTRDAMGVESDPVLFTVSYAQQYEGPVPNGFVLSIELTLRDLSKVTEIRQEFVTGPNNYGVEAWVEGPIALDEVCTMGATRQREGIKYVATIQNYIGTKAQHTVPFADDDYRGTDFLASMITGGVFSYRGLNEASLRRDVDGKELPALLSGITEQDIRDNVDCFGAIGVDACTRATAHAGRHAIPPWTPRQRGGSGLLDQGDYLLWILINLDRDGSWLSANDFETCWGDPADRERGLHRYVQRISLGASPYELYIPQSEELFGADREGAGKLYYVTEDGVTVRWGPSQ